MEDTAARDLVVATVQEHAESLLRVARRYSGCATDAEDAYQRALEIFVRNAGRLDPATAFKWLHTVVKHEALEVRRQRARLVGVDDEATLDALDDGRHLPSTEERSERFEEMTRAAEALRSLKPQEVTALVLKAQGFSYNEIAEREGWTYTKVNRCLTEGRRSFLARVAGIESGAECERWAPVLSAMADGEARARDVLAVRAHLRNCRGCRATLGEMRRAPAAAAALVPLGLPVTGAASGGILARLGELLAGVPERMAAPLVKAQSALEASGAAKATAVAASAVAIAGGGVAVQRSSAGEPPEPRSTPAAAAVRAPEPSPQPQPEEAIVTAAPARKEPPKEPSPRADVESAGRKERAAATRHGADEHATSAESAAGEFGFEPERPAAAKTAPAPVASAVEENATEFTAPSEFGP